MRWKKSTQKLLSLVLTLAMLVSMVPSAFAAEEGQSQESDGTPAVTQVDEGQAPVNGSGVDEEPGTGDNEVDGSGLWDDPVIAEINGQEYTSLETILEAIGNATDETTIKLISSFETSDINGSVPFTIKAGQNFTLDLNGQTITYTSTNQNSYFIHNSGTLTITDTSAEQTGKIYSTRSAAVMNYSGGTTVINAGTFETPNGYAVYSLGNLTVSPEQDKEVILTGSGALQVIRGTVEISGGTFIGENYYAIYTEGNASTTTISDGKFQGKTNSLYYNTTNSKIEVNGGEFVGGFAGKVSSENLTISGGTFSSDVSDYVAKGYEYDSETGEVTKTETTTYVAQIGSTQYTTLANAIANVGDGETITLLCDVPDAVGVSVPEGKNFTIDFAGHTYTVGDPGAGSTGTETQAFQLLKDSTITFKNGTIRIAKDTTSIKRIIQNYANLTLEDMTFYAENQLGGEDYALSFNYGSIVFKGNTSVYTTSNDTVAFDVYFWNTPSYIEGVSVTFDESYTGTINGVILYDSTNAGKAALTIAGNGKFGAVKASDGSTAEPNISISGGTFNSEVPKEYCADGFEPKDNGDGTYGVQPKSNAVASIGTKEYTTLDAAIEAVQPGETIILLANVELADDTPVKIAGKGTAEQPITLDLKGHTISGNNGNRPTSSTYVADSGILTVYGSYVKLTDSSDNKGGITNTNTASLSTSIITVLPSDTNESHLTVDGGVMLVNDSLKSSSKGIYVYGGSSGNAASVTVENANISSYCDAVATQDKTNVSAVIKDGSFETKGDRASAISYHVTVNGGTFTRGKLYNKLDNIGAGKVAVLEKNDDGVYVVTVVDEEGADYTARLSGTSLCVKGDLYIFQDIEKLAKQTINVVQDASLTFPVGESFGSASGISKKLTLKLANGVTLSGSVPLALADITVTGEGTVAREVFKPADETIYQMQSSGEKGLYSCGFIDPVAQITFSGGNIGTYRDVDVAVGQINSSGAVEFKLLKNISTATQVNKGSYSDVTIDLNDFTYTYTGTGAAFVPYSGRTLTIKNGILECSSESSGIAVQVGNPSPSTGNLVIKSDATVKGTISMAVGTLDVYGTVDTTAFTVFGAIVGNGSVTDGTTINIYDGAKVTSADNTTAIYHPQAGTLNISGGEISGGDGIYMKSGTLNLTGGTITGNGKKADYTYNGSGYEPTGDAIVLEACDYPGGAPVVAAFGGEGLKVISENNQAVVCYVKDATVADIADKNFITGGTFSSDVTEYCETGYAAERMQDASGNYIVKQADYVAQVLNADGTEGTSYATLAEAITAAQAGDTVKLLKDVKESIQVTGGKEIVLDLGEKTLTGQVTLNGGKLTLRNGTVTNYGQVIAVYGSKENTENYSVLDIEKTAIVTSTYYWSVCVYGYEDSRNTTGYGTVVNIDGTLTGVVFVSGNLGNTEESATAMMASANAPKINVRGNARITGYTPEEQNSPGQAIAMNGYAIVNVEEGAEITGSEAIGVKRGVLNITGGTFTGTGEKKNPAEANNSGTESTGAAISVTSTYNKFGIIDVNISGGTFNSTNNSALYVGHSKGTNSVMNAYEKGVEISVADGIFKSPANEAAVYIAEAIAGDAETYTQGVISGGQFSSAVPNDYCAEGFVPVTEPNADGMYTVERGTSVAAVVNDNGETINSYATLQEAINAVAETGTAGTVKLLASTAESVTVPANADITLDLNGKTLTNTEGNDTITVTLGATLTIADNSTGEVGTVDNVSHARAAIYNEVGATCTILAGNYTRSMENGVSKEDNGGNSYYTILNHGTMTFEPVGEDNSKITVSQGEDRAGRYSSMIENGWQNGNQKPANAAESVMTIKGGTFTGGLNTVKNDDYGQLTISGGVFKNASQATIMNWNVAEISGGEFSSDHYVVLNGYGDDTMDQGELTINGGSFTAGDGYSVIAQNGKAIGQVTITDGTFTYTGENADVIHGYTAGINSEVAISGGVYSGPVDMDYCATSKYPAMNNADATKTDYPYTVGDTAVQAAIVGSSGKIVSYHTLNEALQKASSGDDKTVQLLDDVTAGTVNVTPGVTLDLNGKTLEATTGVMVSGTLTDSSNNGTGGDGLLKVTTLGNINNSAQLPVYDTTAGGYRLYQYTFKEYGTQETSTGVRFWYQLLFNNTNAYQHFMSEGHKVEIYADASWGDAEEEKLSNLHIYTTTWQAMAKPIVEDGIDASKCGLYIGFTGLDSIAGKTLTVTAKLQFDSNVDAGSAKLSYTVPAATE